MDIEKFFILCKEYLKAKQDIYAKYQIDNSIHFNIFESISDKWYRENFHSDILYTILNPRTPEIGNLCYLKKFVSYLELPSEQFDCNTRVDVIKEAPTGDIYWAEEKHMKGYIDILIKNDNQAIIIENKINNASDEDNQLIRYVKYVKEGLDIDLDNITIVYLTLTKVQKDDPHKLVENYDDGFKEYKKWFTDHPEKLKWIYAIDEDKCLSNNYLPKCYENLEQNQLQYTYLTQYKKMLDHLGGDAYMNPKDNENIKRIYSTPETFELTNTFSTLWEKRFSCIKEILEKDLNITFEFGNVHECKNFYFLGHESGKFRIFWDGKTQLGFASNYNAKFNESEKNNLFKYIGDIKGQKSVIETKIDNNPNEHFVFCEIEETYTFINELRETLGKLINSSITP